MKINEYAFTYFYMNLSLVPLLPLRLLCLEFVLIIFQI